MTSRLALFSFSFISTSPPAYPASYRGFLVGMSACGAAKQPEFAAPGDRLVSSQPRKTEARREDARAGRAKQADHAQAPEEKNRMANNAGLWL